MKKASGDLGTVRGNNRVQGILEKQIRLTQEEREVKKKRGKGRTIS